MIYDDEDEDAGGLELGSDEDEDDDWDIDSDDENDYGLCDTMFAKVDDVLHVKEQMENLSKSNSEYF